MQSLNLDKPRNDGPRFRHPFVLLEFGPGGLLLAVSPRIPGQNKGVARALTYVTPQSEPTFGDSRLVLRHDYLDKYPGTIADVPVKVRDEVAKVIGAKPLQVRRRLYQLFHGVWVKDKKALVEWKFGDDGYRFIETLMVGVRLENGWRPLTGISTSYFSGKGGEAALQTWIGRKLTTSMFAKFDPEPWTPAERYEASAGNGRRKLQHMQIGEAGACAILFPVVSQRVGGVSDGSCVRFEGVGLGEPVHFFNDNGPRLECTEEVTGVSKTFAALGEPMMWVDLDGKPMMDGDAICDMVRFPMVNGVVDVTKPVYLASNKSQKEARRSRSRKPVKAATKGTPGEMPVNLENEALAAADADQTLAPENTESGRASQAGVQLDNGAGSQAVDQDAETGTDGSDSGDGGEGEASISDTGVPAEPVPSDERQSAAEISMDDSSDESDVEETAALS